MKRLLLVLTIATINFSCTSEPVDGRLDTDNLSQQTQSNDRQAYRAQSTERE